MVIKRIILLSMFFLSSCTHMIFESNGDLPIKISSLDKSRKKLIVVERKHESFLWGIIPKKHEYSVDRYFRGYDIENVGNISISQTQDFVDHFLMYLSFGIYIPSTITYRGWGVEKNGN